MNGFQPADPERNLPSAEEAPDSGSDARRQRKREKQAAKRRMKRFRRRLGITDAKETVTGLLPTGEQITLVHQTGHVYSRMKGETPQVITQLDVNEIGLDECLRIARETQWTLTG